MEIPSYEQALACDSFYYDVEGNPRAMCIRCGCAIDLEFDDYVELSLTEKWGLGMERDGGRWWWCPKCWKKRD